MLLRAGARPRPRDGGRPSRRHAPALDDQRSPTSRREADVILVGDRHARGLARGRRARRLHRGVVAGASARPPDPRHEGADHGVDARIGARLLPASLRARADLVVSVAGNVRHDDAARDARRPDGCRPAARRPRSLQHGTPRRTGGRRGPRASMRQARRRSSRRTSCSGRTGSPRTDPDRFAFLIVNTALGGGMSSRLFQEIREKRGLAYTAYSYHAQYTEAGLFSAYAGTTPGRAAEVVALMRRELEDVRDGGLTREEFERAKSHVKGSTVLSLEDPGGRMSRLGKSEIAHGEILTLDETLARVQAVTLDDARRVAERVLSQPMTLAVLGPGTMKGLRGVARMTRVGVLGAAGRMGREVCRAVDAADDLDLVAAIDRDRADRGRRRGRPRSIEALVRRRARRVAVDFTHPSAVDGQRPRGACARHPRRGGHHRDHAGGPRRAPRARGRAGPRTASSRRTSRSAPSCCCGSRPRPPGTSTRPR